MQPTVLAESFLACAAAPAGLTVVFASVLLWQRRLCGRVEAARVALAEQLAEARLAGSRLEERVAHLTQLQDEAAALQRVHAALQGEFSAQCAKEAHTRSVAEQKADQVMQLTSELTAAREHLAVHRAHVAELGAQLSAEQQQSRARQAADRLQFEEKLVLLRDAKTQLGDSFQKLANDIFIEKTRLFSQHNKDSLEQVLKPMQTQLEGFRKKVEEVYVTEGKDRSGLAAQVRQLMELNVKLSDEAHNLTRALKGSNKVQGDWGEVILERLLEDCGLRAGQDYFVQQSHAREDGSRVRPDVSVRLPDNKHLIIDAKTSLADYVNAVNAPTEALRDAALRRHVDSVQDHIKGLATKDYQDLHGGGSPDFVLMFIPIEPAFMALLNCEPGIWERAWARNILLVSPSTLLFVLRTVAHLWRQEQQQHNVQEIARRGEELYNKFVGFVEDMQQLGERLRTANRSYDAAFNKLKDGKGNLIRQAEMLRKLGLKPSKQLSPRLVEECAVSAPAVGVDDGTAALPERWAAEG